MQERAGPLIARRHTPGPRPEQERAVPKGDARKPRDCGSAFRQPPVPGRPPERASPGSSADARRHAEAIVPALPHGRGKRWRMPPGGAPAAVGCGQGRSRSLRIDRVAPGRRGGRSRWSAAGEVDGGVCERGVFGDVEPRPLASAFWIGSRRTVAGRRAVPFCASSAARSPTRFACSDDLT
jgi:hypothetical protein